MCVFCKIISKEFSSNIVYEDDYTLAFLDLSQSNDGHTLVVPKKHVENIFDMDDETISHVFKTVNKVSKAISKALNVNNINIINNNGKTAGQSVFHFHIHIIPRHENDQIKLEVNDRSKELNPEDYTIIKDKIKSYL